MLKPDTIKIQEDLAMYCRTGKEAAIPGVTPGRLPHYRRLVHNIVHGAIAQAYPVTRKVLSEKEWNYLFYEFIVEHDSQTPILWRLPYEFYTYVKESGYDDLLQKPWLTELLWFEWLEIEVHMMPDTDLAEYQYEGDIFEGYPLVNPDSRLIQLEYPVHLHPVEEAIQRKGKYYVFIYRGIESGTVRFVGLSVLHAWLLDRLMNGSTNTVKEIMPDLEDLVKNKDENKVEGQIKKFLEEMLEKRVLLGFRK